MKAGWQTSEFYVALIPPVLSLLVLSGVLKPGDQATLEQTMTHAVTAIATALGAVWAVVTYIKSRTQLKIDTASKLGTLAHIAKDQVGSPAVKLVIAGLLAGAFSGQATAQLLPWRAQQGRIDKLQGQVNELQRQLNERQQSPAPAPQPPQIIYVPSPRAPEIGQPPVYAPPLGQPPVYTPPLGQPPVYSPPVGAPPVYTPPVGAPPSYGPPLGAPPTYNFHFGTPPVYSPPVGAPVTPAPLPSPGVVRPPPSPPGEVRPYSPPLTMQRYTSKTVIYKEQK